jgi:hypothetical protein
MGGRAFRAFAKAPVLCVVAAGLLAPGVAHAESFTGPTNFAAGSAPTGIAIGQFSADTNADLAVANDASNNVSILLGNGSGGFTGPTNLAAGIHPVSVAVGRFNADANDDLAVANDGSNNVSILLGNGSGGFTGPTNFGAGFSPLEVAIGKFNADANLDLAVANESSNDVSILLGNGTGGFTGPTAFPANAGPGSIVVGRFNADANDDLAVSNDFSNDVSVLLGDGTGAFTGPTNFPVGAAPAELTAAQLNGDANVDLAIANAGGNVSVLLGNGTGGFGAPSNFGAGPSPSSLADGDLDGDSHIDLAVSDDLANNIAVLLGNAAGGFIAPNSFAAGSGPASIAVGQLNGDTRPDLATANELSNNVSVLLNTTPIGYPRPKGATPLRVSLVPAYQACASPNSTHGTPLAFGSCKPPAQASSYVTLGSPDANGAPANSQGSVTYSVVINPTPTPNDVLINASITDVRCTLPVNTTCGDVNTAAGPDYTGALQALSNARITDQHNAVGGGDGTAAGTVQDLSLLPLSIPCSVTAAPSLGATCATSTSANALVPGTAKSGHRAIWELTQLRVTDGGGDGNPATAGNTDILAQGVFVP